MDESIHKHGEQNEDIQQILSLQLSNRLSFSLIEISLFPMWLQVTFCYFSLVLLHIDTVSYARMAERSLLRPSDLYYRELTHTRILNCVFGASNLHNPTGCDCIKLL